MRIDFSKIKLLIIMFCLVVAPVFAQENIISSVTISKAKNKVNNYELSIDSTITSDYKMSVEDDNAVYFDLKNAILADDATTYYDDVINVNSVVVKQIGHNKVRIYLQGKNVKNSSLVFLNELVEDTTPKTNAITINRPMKEYAPVNNVESEDVNGISDWENNTFSINNLLSSLKSGMAGIVIIFLIIFTIIISALKALSNKLLQENEPLIGLQNQKLNIEEEFNKQIQKNKINNQVNNLKDITKRTQTLQNAQEELAKAHLKYQQYLQNKQNNMPKKQYTSDSIKQGIALNQYQKSNMNPYKNQKVVKMENINQIQSSVNYNSSTRNASQLVQSKMQVQKNTSPYIQRKSNLVENKMYTKPNNMKFLESVSKIYEQTGRPDLALELKNSINKVKKI